jgi:cytochrome c oxidase subunit II
VQVAGWQSRDYLLGKASVSPNRIANRRADQGAAPGAPAPAQPVPSATPRQRAPLARLARWVPAVAVGAAVLLLTTGCRSSAFTRLGMLPPVTKQGKVTLALWQGSWIAAFAVGILVWGAIIYAVIFFRKRSNRVPQQVRYNLPIEILYTVVPFFMIGVLFFFTARDENYIDSLPPNPQVVVNVTGFQWSWEFQYPQYKVPHSEYRMVTELGEMWNGDTPGNEGQLPLLEIPIGETVRFNLTSTDVVHSFWIVPFEFKRDVIPDHPNHFQVTPTAAYSGVGRCTELCGVYHSRMLFNVKIVPAAQFRKWIAAQQAQQNTTGGVQ